jgi:hypothetical protein
MKFCTLVALVIPSLDGRDICLWRWWWWMGSYTRLRLPHLAVDARQDKPDDVSGGFF